MTGDDEHLHERSLESSKFPQEGSAAMRRNSAGGEASGEHILFERTCRPTQSVHAWMHDRNGSRLGRVIQLTLRQAGGEPLAACDEAELALGQGQRRVDCRGRPLKAERITHKACG
jgi:hypothetical protein